jgi:hypothetical protein
MIAYANQSTTGRKGCINPLKGFPGCAAAGTYPHAAGEKTPRRVRIHLPAKSSIFALHVIVAFSTTAGWVGCGSSCGGPRKALL